MRRVLIVTGSYYPAVLADTHRARLLGPALKEFDWNAEILAAGIEFQRADAIEEDAAPFFDFAIPVHFAARSGGALFDLLNMRSIGWRAFWPTYQKGIELLSQKRFDLVYITTAQFNFFCLGYLWRRKLGVPYVLDFHDPWVRTELRNVTTKHKVKFYVSSLLARSFEKYAVRDAAGVVSVSPTYVEQLRDRYGDVPALKQDRVAVIPFAASDRDLSLVPAITASESAGVAYVGAGGPIMEKSWRRLLALIEALKAEKDMSPPVKFKFFGTEAFWKQGGRKFLVEIAKEYGLEDRVDEHPLRISYSRALETIQSSVGLVILGVDDPAYMPSKLFLYALSGKPLLASLHAESQANRYFEQCVGLGHVVHFDLDGARKEEVELTEVRNFFCEVKHRSSFDRRELIAPYLTQATAKRHASLFHDCIKNTLRS